MAKKLLLDALTAAIGDFVEGISEENLKVGIWSGKVSRATEGMRKRRCQGGIPSAILNIFIMQRTTMCNLCSTYFSRALLG